MIYRQEQITDYVIIPIPELIVRHNLPKATEIIQKKSCLPMIELYGDTKGKKGSLLIKLLS